MDLSFHPSQLATARYLWQGFVADMAELLESRQRIIQDMYNEDQTQPAEQRSAYSISENTIRLLQNVAELRRSAALQQELVANMHRTFLLQVCCPDTYGRLVRRFWPYHPDLTRLLCRLAGGASLR